MSVDSENEPVATVLHEGYFTAPTIWTEEEIANLKSNYPRFVGCGLLATSIYNITPGS
jgi:hypothetical protein